MMRCLLLLFLSAPYLLSAQCPLSVSAGPDQFVCNPGGAVELQGSITGQELGFRWTPTTGLTNAGTLTPTATVTGPVTYTLTAAAVDPSAPNLVVNPGFEQGVTGYSSGYAYNPLPISPGTYTLTTSPELVFSNFPPCDDHTFGNGTGNMMLVNGNGSANSQVWCQTIPVTPNSWYVMSAWALVSPISPPVFQFSVNGAFVGDPAPIQFDGCTWQQFSASWFSGSATSASLCIHDISGSGNGLFGDDYALDDVFMARACTVSDQVNVSVVTLNAVAPTSVVLNCNSLVNGITLNGSASSSGPNITYEWDGPGILSGGNTPIVTVNEPGLYTLTVYFTAGGTQCTRTATVNVLPDPFTVEAFAAANDVFSCANATVTIDGGGSTTGPLITYSWSPAANVTAGGATLNPVVNQPGNYTLLVTHPTGNCTATATVNVGQNYTPAVAVATASGTLPCLGGGAVTLNGTGSSIGNDYDYVWTGPGIVSGANTLNNCVVNAAGVYILTVTNYASGCTATASVSVTQNGVAPLAVANAPGVLNCNTPNLTLNSAGSSSGANITYQWSSVNGSFAGPTNGPTALVDTVGTYTLLVTNQTNGCTASSSVVVNGQFTPPVIAFAPAAALNCQTDSIRIDAGATSNGPGFSYQWSTANGQLLSGQNTLAPWVSAAGAYQLSVTNTANGCTSVSTINVPVDTVPPPALISAAAGSQLNCIQTTVVLTGNSGVIDTSLVYQWSTLNGHFAGPVNTSSTLVDSTGWYLLEVRDTLNGCTATDSFWVSGQYDLPVAAIAAPLPLSCTRDSVSLDGGASSVGTAFVYQWSTNGGILLSGAQTLSPWAAAAGTYQLWVTDTTNGCTATQTIAVPIDTLLPNVDITAPVSPLDCQTTLLSLAATGSSGAQINWYYTPAPGSTGAGIVSGQQTLQPVVNAPGWYTLVLQNNGNGCIDSATVQVNQDITPPLASAGPAPTVDCNDTMAMLDGSGSSQGAAFTYAWSNGSTDLQTSIFAPGQYYITVVNQTNQCAAVDSVWVAPFGGAPDVNIAPAPLITCASPTIDLTATASTGNEYVYEWTFAGTGTGIINGGATLQVTVGSTGDYTLLVTHTGTGCTAAQTVTVTQSSDVPMAEAGAGAALLCGITAVTLDGGGSSSGPNIVYQWSTGDGLILQGADGLSPEVGAAGTYTLLVTNTGNGCSATDAVLVTQDANAPEALIAAPQGLTCLSPISTLDASASSSGPGILYAWNTTNGQILNGANTLTPEIGSGGVYTLTVINTNNNCQSVAGVNVPDLRQNPLAVAGVAETLTCANEQVTLNTVGSSGGPQIQFNWNGPGIVAGGNTDAPLVDAPGNYNLTVTDLSNGCTAEASVSVLEDLNPPLANAIANQALNCLQDEVSIDGNGSSPGMSYFWSGPGIVSGAQTLNPVVNAPGTYVLLVANPNNACTATTTVTINADLDPPTAIAAANTALTCQQTQVTLSGAGSSAGLLYNWSGPGIVSGANTLTPTVATAGVYTLTVSNPVNGCSATASATLNANTAAPAALIAAADTLTCLLTSVALQANTGAGWNYQWSGPGIVGGADSPSIVVQSPGFYTLTLTDTANGCTNTAIANVVENRVLPNVQIALPDTLTCLQTSVTLQGSGAASLPSFEWSSANGQISAGANSATPVVNAAGVYSLTVTDLANGCTNTAQTSVVAVVAQFPTAQVQAPDCAQASGVVTFVGGQGPYLYSMDGGAQFQSDPVFGGLGSGDYTGIVQDANGCEDSVLIEIPEVFPVVISLPATATVSGGQALTLNPVLNLSPDQLSAILWTPAERLSCADCLNPVVQPGDALQLWVTALSTTGCSDTASILVNWTTQSDYYVPNTFSPGAEGENGLFRLYANGTIEGFEMQIYDRWGSLLFVNKDPGAGWDGRARGRLQESGVYVYWIRFDWVQADGKKTPQLIKGDVTLLRQ